MFKNKKIHMIGIGGISMSAIALILKNEGAIVTGSNTEDNDNVVNLKNNGIDVFIGHNENMINENIDLVIYTKAISDNDEEFVKAKKLNLIIYERATFLGQLSKNYKNCICISGTHGKSTTTGLASLSFIEAKLNPTIQIGAILHEIGGNLKIGSNDYLIMEACEYKNSFLNFFPTSIIITNIELDHTDFFKDLNDFVNSFQKYINLLPKDGILIINNDDENTKKLNTSHLENVVTYGIDNESEFTAKNIKHNNQGFPCYDIFHNNEFVITINLNIRGIHNVYNSLAVFALGFKHNANINDLKNGLEKYKGVERRFEYIGKYNDVFIYDDYAHHPTEILTTYNTVKKMTYNKNWAVFQSHTFSRTNEFLKEFADALKNFDNIIIAPIYPAREINTYGVSEDQLVNLIKVANPNVLYLNSYDKIVSHLKENIDEGDLVVTVGAGPVNEVAKKLVKSGN